MKKSKLKRELIKKKIRGVIVLRNTLIKMSQSRGYKNNAGQKYINDMAVEVMNLAKRINPLLPYYLSIKAI